MSNDWLTNFSDAFFNPGSFGSAANVTPSALVQNTVLITRAIGVVALTIGTGGVAGELAAGWLGAEEAATWGGSLLVNTLSGATSAGAENAAIQLTGDQPFSWRSFGLSVGTGGLLGGALGAIAKGLGSLGGGPGQALSIPGFGTMTVPATLASAGTFGVPGVFAGVAAGALFSTTGNNPQAVQQFLASGARVRSAKGIGAGGMSQLHHIASDKDPFWTQRFARLFRGAGLDLNDPINLIDVPGHQGPHGIYNLMVLDRLEAAVANLQPGTVGYTTALEGELNLLRADVLNSGPGGLYNLLTSSASKSERILAKGLALLR